MRERGERSPWWYRRRGALIAAIYVAGFALGYPPLGSAGAEPSAVVLGARLGASGVALVLWAGIAAALVAWMLRFWGAAYLRGATVFADDVQSDRLVVAGPFRYVRNPLYLGNVFLALAAGTLATPPGAAIVVLGNAVFGVLLAGEEARELQSHYGPVYDAFRAAVPAFVPRLTPARVAGSVDAAPSFRSAALGESFSLVLAVALVPMALFGEAGVPAFFWLWFGSLPLYVAVNWWAQRRRTSRTAPRT